MKIAIFGSCVSRDTCEYMDDAKVLVYVARQSATSQVNPRGTSGLDTSELASKFQVDMVRGDLSGDALARILDVAASLDLVLIDLIDERRGFWLWPDGTTMTNSLEVETAGGCNTARAEGARLVEFGTDEHFKHWMVGFNKIIRALHKCDLLERTILLDIQWADHMEGSKRSNSEVISRMARRYRQTLRGLRELKRVQLHDIKLGDYFSRIFSPEKTDAEMHYYRAKCANKGYKRYRSIASRSVGYTIFRDRSEVEIGENHRWGPQPFHYRDVDYLSVASDIRDRIESIQKTH
ncbi:hypothetical protein CXR25_02430 [Brevibacterium aurantiacum]|uniref:DUF6270 domain-containing protein n=1 Tax=Brevibacterium aurantiacum TaxID=273384 RepID=UPI000F651897|nr:DUF6270 domain-containing protein [Brevibacterium aurantiacum]AZL11797.1 hypothetical protein CXR25_02430 [Brevibacterium aurantiacum]